MQRLFDKWYIIVVSFVTIFFGISMIRSPEMLNYYNAYEILRWWTTPNFLGTVFVSIGLLKLVAIVMQNRLLKLIAVCALVFIWLFVGTSFHLAESATSIHIFCYGIAFTALGTLLSEVVE